MRNLKLARRYAEALGDLASERGQLDQVDEELQAVMGVLNSRPDFQRLLGSQKVKREEKERALRAVFGDQLSRITLNFLLLVISKRREAHLQEMSEELTAYADRQRNVVEVEVKTAAPLSQDQSESIAARLSEITGKRIRLMTKEDETLLGGIVARIGDLVMDGSVKTRLSRLGEALKRAKLN